MTIHKILVRWVISIWIGWLGSLLTVAESPLIITDVECAGISGFRAHWDRPIMVEENGKRVCVDKVVTDRGHTAIWDGTTPGPLAFDAVHRMLLVRFPSAAKQIAERMENGWEIEKVELILPYLDEEIWPQGQIDYPSPDGYRFRMNWNCDILYRRHRPNWHAVGWILRKPWKADPQIGPTYNAAINGAVYWKRFGASDIEEDRFPMMLGPTEVSSYCPEGRMDLTPIVKEPVYGQTLGERLLLLSDNGILIQKWEIYDMRFYNGVYEFTVGTGPRAILIRNPKLAITFRQGKAMKLSFPQVPDVARLWELHRSRPIGNPSAVIPSLEEFSKINAELMQRPEWMSEWQYQRVRELFQLKDQKVRAFPYYFLPPHVSKKVEETIKRKIQEQNGEKKQKLQDIVVPEDLLNYEFYLAWLDWIHGERPRSWEGHMTAQQTIVWWYKFRRALPDPVQESIRRSWSAWLMPDRETEMNPKLRRQYDNVSGKLVHPMVDDPRVGKSADGKPAEQQQGDTYYKKTGDWRGNKSFFRSGFTREISTANFNSTATCGALLCGQIIGSKYAIEDGRHGLMAFPFWMWTYNAGAGQEYIDHYYWAIAIAGNKLFSDFCEDPQDQSAGWSIMLKTINDLAIGYHPELKKLIGPASRTADKHFLGQQDGLYHILHFFSQKGTLTDMETRILPAISTNPKKPISAWGHDVPPELVAMQSLCGPWSESWFTEWIDEKPLPWEAYLLKKVVAQGDWITTYFSSHYGLASIAQTSQRLHLLGHWKRSDQRPQSMTEIGTLDIRMGVNETRVANDGDGVISQIGHYRCYQSKNKLMILARPNVNWLKEQKVPIQTVQCTIILHNYQNPSPSWSIYLNRKKVDQLPISASVQDTIIIHDGVTYLTSSDGKRKGND